MFIPVRFAIYIVIDRWFRVAAEDPHFGHARRRGWRRGRRGRFRFAKIRQGYAPDGLGNRFADLPQHKRQCSHALCKNELLRLLGRNLDGHGLNHGRVFLAVVGDLARRENLDVLQQDVGVGTAFLEPPLIKMKSTRSPIRTKPATPRASSTRTETARMPGSVSAAREAGWLGPVIRELRIGSFLFIEVRAARAPSFKRSPFDWNAPSGTIDDSHGASLTFSSVSVVPYSKGPAATTIVLTGPLATIISGGFEPLARTAAPIPAAREMPRTTRRAGGIGILRAVFICMDCLSYLHRAIEHQGLHLRSSMQRRGGSWKTGHELQHLNTNVGLTRLFQFILLLQNNIRWLPINRL
jgi:hypothetical protein